MTGRMRICRRNGPLSPRCSVENGANLPGTIRPPRWISTISREWSKTFSKTSGSRTRSSSGTICRPITTRPAATRILASGRLLGYLGRISDRTASAFDLREIPFVCELDLTEIGSVRIEARPFVPLPRTPAVGRDLALILDRNIEAGRVLVFLNELQEEYLTEVSLFDAYEGKQLDSGLKSPGLPFPVPVPGQDSDG